MLASSPVDVLGDKWTPLILRNMVFAGKSTYGQFLQSAKKMATIVAPGLLAELQAGKDVAVAKHQQLAREKALV